jgi:hypothetical protein
MSGFAFPPEIQRLMLEMQIESIERRRKAVLADPAKHKTTLEFPEDARMSSRYWGDIKTRGKRYRYCYSTERNLAGYFLCWREVWHEKKGIGERDMFTASKRRLTVREQARKRHEAHKAKLGKK